MADAQSNLYINIDTAQALANIKALQAQVSAFQTSMAKGNAAQQSVAQGLERQILGSINATGQFAARMTTVANTTETFTNNLEKNRLSMREYYRYGMASTRTFGRFFRSEFDTINKVARERVKTLQTQYVKMGRDANGALRAIAVRPLALDMESLATKTAMAAQRQQIFNQVLKQGSTNLLNFGKNTQWAGRQLMVGFTIPLSIMGTMAIREFKKIEEQAVKFRRVYGDVFSTDVDTEKALKNVRDLADEFTKYGIAVEKTIGLASTVAQMGNVGSDLVSQVTEATRLSVLGGIEQEEALNTTISLTNAFGTANQDLAKDINFLNAVENQTILSIEDFNEAIPKAGSVVKQLGGDVKDLAFFLTAMREGGINASESANALKSGLASMINPTEKSAEMLAEFGINIRGIVDANAGDLKGTVIGFAQALDTLDPLNRARAIEQLFGKFQFARISTLFQNVLKEGSQAQQVLKLTQSSTSELAVLAERELKRVEDSPAFKLDKQIEKLKASLAPVGEEFVKLITPLIEFATKILDQFNNLDSGVKGFITGTIAVLGGIAPIALMTFGLLANGVANIIKLFGLVRGVYQKAGSQSQVLGQQTSYMTQEQLEAAAVAASLNQSHNVLIQTFTSEIGALNNLTAAYQRVAAAQAKAGGRFGPGIATTIGKTKVPGFANGILSVPGPKGAGDIIPAMLSPGESVIPAKQSEKYAGFISAIMNDEVPGFKTGVRGYPGHITVDEQIKREYSPAAATAAQKALAAEQAAVQKAVQSSPLTQKDNAKNVAAAQRAHTASVDKNVAATLPKAQQLQLWKFGSVVRPETLAANNLTQSFASSERNRNLFQPYLAKSVADQAQLARINSQLSSGAALSMTDEKAYAKALKSLDKDLVSGKAKTNKDFKDTKSFSPNMRFAGAVGAGITAKQAALANAPAAVKQEIYTDPKKAQSTVDKIFKDNQKAVKDNTKAKVNDTKATEKQVKETKKATKTSVKATEAKQANTKQVVKATEDAKKRPFTQTTNSRGQTVFRDASTGKMISKADAEQRQRFQARSEAAKKAAATRAENRTIAARPPEQPKASGMDRMRTGMGRAAGVAGGASMAAMMYSMSGGPGADIAGQLIMPLMGLGMVLPLLANPVGLVVAGLAAAAGAFFLVNKALNDATKSGIATAEAMALTNEKLIAISEFTGTVTATEARMEQQATQMTSQSEPTRQFGMQFLESEPGKQIVEDVKTQLAAGEGIGEVGENIGLQLSQAISQGALDVEQARGIAAALGQEFNDYTFAANINGTVTQIIGPNGEDLSKDPLQVAIRIQDESMAQAEQGFDSAFAKIEENAAVTGGTIGNLIGGGIMFAAGTAMTVLSAGTLAVPGLALMAAGGTTFGGSLFMEGAADAAENNEITGQAITQAGQQLAIQQQNLDFVKQTYAEKIATQEAELEIAKSGLEIAETDEQRLQYQQKIANVEREISDLQRRRQGDVSKLTAASFQNQKSLIAQVDKLREMGQLDGALQETINKRYEDDPLSRQTATNTLDQIKAMEDSSFKSTLQIAIVSGTMAPTTISRMIELADGNTSMQGKFDLVIEQQGIANFDQLFQLMEMGGVGGSAFGSIFESFIGKDADTFDERLQALSTLAQIPSLYGIEVDLNTNGEEKLDAVVETMQQLDSYPDPLTKESVMKLAKQDPELYDAILADWTRLSGSDNTLEKQIIINAKATGNGWDAVAFYLSENGMLGSEKSKAQAKALSSFGMPSLSAAQSAGLGSAVEAETRRILTEEFSGDAGASFMPGGGVSVTPGTAEVEEDTGTGSGGGGAKSEDPYEDILRQLRNLRDASIDTSLKFTKLNEVIGSGNKLKIFSGVQNQLLAMGANGNFIDWLLVQEEDIQKQFMTVKNGIVSLTKEGLTAQQAFNEINIGEVFLDAQQQTRTIQDQQTAVRKLISAGYDLSKAYELVKDEALAAALASEQVKVGTEEWDKLTEQIKMAEDAAKQFTAAQQLANTVADFAQSQETLDWIQANQDILSGDLINEILNNPALQQFIAEGPNLSEEDRALLEEFLQGFVDREAFELEIKKLTIEGLEEIFNDGFNKAMEAFAAEEKAIELEYEVLLADDNKLVEDAQNQIAAINFEVDDLEAQLRGIEEQEESINEKYDSKLDALDQIQSINQEIARQAEAQLTIADALSRGDISAAAVAAQRLRASNAEARTDNQKKLLEKSRELELGRIVSQNGKTRVQLEQEIKDLKNEIFLIEENTLEPAQERIRLAEIEKNQRLSEIEILGRTRLEWEQVKNGIDLAKTRSDIYKDAIQQALDVVKDIEDYWNGLNRTVTTTHQINEIINRITQGEPAPAPTPTPTPTGGGSGSSGGGGGSGTPSAPSGPTVAEQIESHRSKSVLFENTVTTQTSNWNKNPSYRTKITYDAINHNINNFNSLMDKIKALGGVPSKKYRLIGALQSPNLDLQRFQSGGMVQYLRMGGMLPYKSEGGSIFKPLGTDTIPAMLSPGEFVVRRSAVEGFGVDRLSAINSGTYSGESVYNYSVNVNVKSDSNPDQIARAVMTQIKQIDSQRIRSNRF